MIVIKIEMWPGGNAERATELARATIANQVNTTVQTSGTRGDYVVELRGGVHGRPDLLSKVWKRGSVVGFDRVRRGTWDLVYLALKNIVGDRNA